MHSTQWFLGVDGGQSGTVALIANQSGVIAGAGHAGPCNHVSTEEAREKYRNAIGGAVREALQNAGLSKANFAGACLGLSGGPADKEALTRAMISADRYVITHDAAIALAGALGGKPGVIVIAGTGSIAYGRNSADKTARVGGWATCSVTRGALSTLSARRCARHFGTKKDGDRRHAFVRSFWRPRARKMRMS